MAENNRDIAFRITTESDPSGATQAADALKGVGDAAQSATTGTDALTTATTSVDASLQNVSTSAQSAGAATSVLADSMNAAAAASAAQKAALDSIAQSDAALVDGANRVADAMKRLGEDQSPIALGRNVTKAQLALEALRATIEQVRAAGGIVAPEALAQLDAMEAKIAALTVTAAQYRQVQREMRLEGALAAGDMRVLAGSMGSATGAMSLMSSSSASAVAALGEIGLAVIVVAEAYKLAEKGAKWLGDQFDKLTDQEVKANYQHSLMPQLLRAIDEGLIKDQGSLEKNVAAWEKYENDMNHVARSIETLIPSLHRTEVANQGLSEALKLLGGFMAKTGGQGEVFNAQMTRLANDGLGRMLLKALQDGEFQFGKYGAAVDAAVKKLILMEASAPKTAAAIGAAALKIAESYNKIAKEADASWQKQEKDTKEGLKILNDELDKNTITWDEYLTKKRALIEADNEAFFAAQEKKEAAMAVEEVEIKKLGDAHGVASKQVVQFGVDELVHEKASIAAAKADTEGTTALNNFNTAALAGPKAHLAAAESIGKHGKAADDAKPPMDRLAPAIDKVTAAAAAGVGVHDLAAKRFAALKAEADKTTAGLHGYEAEVSRANTASTSLLEPLKSATKATEDLGKGVETIKKPGEDVNTQFKAMGLEGKHLAGSFEGSSVAAKDQAESHGVLAGSGHAVTASLVAIMGPATTLTGGYGKMTEKSDDSAKSVASLTGKGKDLLVSLDDNTDASHKLTGGLGDAKSKGTDVLKGGIPPLIQEMDGLKGKMEELISTAERFRQAFANAAGTAGTGAGFAGPPANPPGAPDTSF